MRTEIDVFLNENKNGREKDMPLNNENEPKPLVLLCPRVPKVHQLVSSITTLLYECMRIEMQLEDWTTQRMYQKKLLAKTFS